MPAQQPGAPLEDNVIKCQLKSVDEADYAVKFTAAELARLKAIFPDGVCDYTKLGVEQTHMRGTWRTF